MLAFNYKYYTGKLLKINIESHIIAIINKSNRDNHSKKKNSHGYK